MVLDIRRSSNENKKLPKEIEDLKTLIEAHSKTDQMNFYIIHKQEKN